MKKNNPPKTIPKKALPQKAPPLPGKTPPARVKESRRLKKHRRQALLAVMLVFLTFYVIISLFVTAYYYYSFNSTPKAAKLYSVKAVGPTGKTIAAENSEGANKYRALYVSLSTLDKLCDLSYAGDGETLTVMFRNSGEALDCFTNSSFLYINGNPARLTYPVMYEKKLAEYYFPVELVEQYFIGVDVEYKKGDCLLSLTSGRDTVIGLKLKEQQKSQNIAEPTASGG